MYESHWKLHRRPFDDGPAAEFYFPGRVHQAALLKLRYLIEQDKGLGLIVGEHGLGKTYLTQVLEQDLSQQGTGPFIRLLFPQLPAAEALHYFADRMGVALPLGCDAARALKGLEDCFERRQHERQHPVFLIDDAHLLGLQQLQFLQQLLNLRENGRARFSLILSGRTELLAHVARVAGLDQRIVVRTALTPLDQSESAAYMAHRLSIAGGPASLMRPESAAAIWRISQGIPRRINQLCDLALLVGYVDELSTVGPTEIEAAAAELVSVAA